MNELLSRAELFENLGLEGIRRLSTIGQTRTLAEGEYLFLLGDNADYLYVVTRGKVDLCFPMSLRTVVQDVPVESAGPGKLVGWSAMVKPYRFTLSARAAEDSQVVGFRRHDLQQLFTSSPEIGLRLLTKLSEIVGIRLLMFQALWARELQRALLAESEQVSQ